MKIISQKFELSNQELQIYSLYAFGYSSAVVAEILQITFTEVRESARCVRDRLSLPSVSHTLFYLALFRYVNIDFKFMFSLLPLVFYKWLGLVLFRRSAPASKSNRFLDILRSLMVRFPVSS